MVDCGHSPAQPEKCLTCCLVNALPADQEADPNNISKLRLSCLYLGKVIDFKNSACPMKHLHQCDKLGQCTLQKCQSCPHYVYDGPQDD